MGVEPEWVAVLTTVFGLISTLVAIWAMVTKRHDESTASQVGLGKVQAEIADIIVDAARDTLTMLNERATEAADARLLAEQRANRMEERNVDLEQSRAGLVHEVEWVREGAQILIAQIMELGQVPKWDPAKTKPLLTSSQVEKMITDLLAENGVAQKLNGVNESGKE